MTASKKTRYEFSSKDRKELWERWRQGESISSIARALNRKPGTIHSTLSQNGGISPSRRSRHSRVLSTGEREEISRGLCSGLSFRQIASGLHRSASTVSREVNRNGGRDAYRAESADTRAWNEAQRPQLCKLAKTSQLCRLVAQKLALKWSPEQISGWLKKHYPTNSSMQISHESIYRSIYIQTRGVLKKELIKHLRQHRVMRRSKKSTKESKRTGSIQNEISIAERPKSVDRRNVPGHWEGDLISGSKNTHVATLVERKSRFTLLIKVEGKDAPSVHKALKKKIRKLPNEVRKSLTWDRGSELACHKELSVDAGIKIYFCDPQSPWQRGTNENTNGLLRQYMPRKTDLSVYSQVALNKIARQLNQRPRKTLGFKTPAEVFERALH